MKMLLYSCKAKPYLRDYRGKAIYNRFVTSPTDRPFTSDDTQPILNGKIVAECDYEVEEIKKKCVDVFKYCYITDTLNEFELMNKTQLDGNTTNNYLKGKNGKAIHIKNLYIFDKPKELSDYYGYYNEKTILKAPQNMMLATSGFEDYKGLDLPIDMKILISIRPEWLCKILNGEKTIEVRKKVLKEML